MWLGVLAIKKCTQKKTAHIKYTTLKQQTFVKIALCTQNRRFARCIPHFIYENWVAVVKWSFSKRFIIVCRQFSCAQFNAIPFSIWYEMHFFFFESQNHFEYVVSVFSAGLWFRRFSMLFDPRYVCCCLFVCVSFFFLHRFNLAFESCCRYSSAF